MSVRKKLFRAMAILVFFMGLAYLASTQGYLRHNLPALVSAAEHDQMGNHLAEGEVLRLHQLEQDIYDSMLQVAAKVMAGLSIIALLLGFWLSRVLTKPLLQLISAIERIGKGEWSTALPVISRDEYGKVTEALNRLAADLARSEEIRKRLVADVAHELRTPLTIMQGQLEFFQQSGQTISPERLLPMQDELIRLSRMVGDLNQLSLAEAGKLPLAKQPTDMAELLARLKELLAIEAEAKGLRLTLEGAPEHPVIVVDRHRIEQVFINLIGNAIRYTTAGGHVSILLREDLEGLIISIKDTGIGIPAEHLPFLFDRFYRVGDDRARHSGGMGLGLAIARQFVEVHNGQLKVESEPGKGTTFIVYLPRGPMPYPIQAFAHRI